MKYDGISCTSGMAIQADVIKEWKVIARWTTYKAVKKVLGVWKTPEFVRGRDSTSGKIIKEDNITRMRDDKT